MEKNPQNELERAKDLFHASLYLEAYSILRRYYDRLPFKQEDGHLEHISIFVRLLSELGKSNELKFYTGILESLYEKEKCPDFAYQLAFVYIESNPPRIKQAKELLEEVIRSPISKKYISKSKMALAYCYDVAADISACRRIIFSIDPTEVEENLQEYLKIWKARVLLSEKNYSQCEQILDEVFKLRGENMDWQTYLFGKTLRGTLCLQLDRLDEARQIVEDLKDNAKNNGRTAVRAIHYLTEKIQERDKKPVLSVSQKLGEITLDYAGRTLSIKGASLAEKLLMVFLSNGKCDKSEIVRTIHERDYQGKEDDQLIYYHVNGVRKILQKLGLDSGAVRSDGNHYRLVPEIAGFIKGEST